MLAGVHNLSRRTKTLHPAKTFEKPPDFENLEYNLDDIVSSFKPTLNGIESPSEEIPSRPIVERYKNYSVKGIKELPCSSGIVVDEESDNDNENGINGDVSDSDCKDSNLSAQLGTKERELQVALQKQERYQSTVQDVTARMERVQQKLSALGSSPFKNLEQQVKEQKVILCILFVLNRPLNWHFVL